MAPDDAESRKKRRRHADDDYGDLDIRKKSAGGGSFPAILAVGGGGLVLLLCLVGLGIGIAVSMARDETAAKLAGSWKARWALPGRVIDSVYTFRKDGTFREESFTVDGRPLNISDGRWSVRNGEVNIDWDNAGFEVATVTWVDEKTMTYRVVDHSDMVQIGMAVTFRKQ
jgi:hypothetical protein